MSQKKRLSFQTHIKDILSKYPDTETCWVAYSGGLDSHVLLHLLAEIKNHIQLELLAVHIDHGMSNDADLWVKHCQKICAKYAIEFQHYSIDLSHKNDRGTEAFAREKRYEVLAGLVHQNDLLLTAHHANDQLETILMQLMRGSGTDGLAGMPQARKFSKGLLIRPLLGYSRKDIYDYALGESLEWIEDASNQSNKYDRNFLRNEIIPKLLTRWQAALTTTTRAAGHQSEASVLINEISSIDLKKVCTNDYKILNLSAFEHLSYVRKKNALRAWVKKNKHAIPTAKLIEKIIAELIYANADCNPCVKWKGVEVRRYRGKLYIMQPLPPHDSSIIKPWSFDDSLELSCGCLRAVIGNGNGIKKELLSDVVEIKYRQGGEQIRPSGRAHRQALKKMLQDQSIAPWLRDRLPLIFYKNELIAVADLWVEHKYAATETDPAWQIIWEWNND